MWTRSAQNKVTGLMTVVCTDWTGAEFFRGEFSDLHEAEKAGQDAERRMTSQMQSAEAVSEITMTDDELLAELLS